MNWHWILLLAGLGIYVLALFPSLLPHTADTPVAMLAAMILASVALLGFDSDQVKENWQP